MCHLYVFWCFNPWRQNPWIGKPSPGLGLLWTRSAVADCQSVADPFSFIIIYVLLFIWSTGIYKFCRIEKTNICLSDSPSFLLFPWSSEIIWSLSDRESPSVLRTMEGRTQKLEHHHAVESWREVAEDDARRYHQKEDISLFIWFGAQQADFGEFNFGQFFALAQNKKKYRRESTESTFFN